MSNRDLLLAGEVEAAAPAKGAASSGWILRRIGLGVLTLLVITILVFVATQVLPGDPAEAILGQAATPQRLETLRAQLDLEGSAVSQYLNWLGNFVTGNAGTSISAQIPVTEYIGSRLGNSLILLALVAVVVMPLALVLGSLAAMRSESRSARLGELLSLIFMALPEFVTGMLLVVIFSTTIFNWLPAASFVPEGETPLSNLEAMILPVATLTLAVLPYLFRLVRASMIDALSADYVQMARLKGVPERTVVRRHALPNALIPAVQGSALMLAYLLGGAVVVEVLFTYPGLGAALADAVADRDLPVIQAITLIFATGIVLFNLLADIATVYLTPRMRTGSR